MQKIKRKKLVAIACSLAMLYAIFWTQPPIVKAYVIRDTIISIETNSN